MQEMRELNLLSLKGGLTLYEIYIGTCPCPEFYENLCEGSVLHEDYTTKKKFLPSTTAFDFLNFLEFLIKNGCASIKGAHSPSDF